MEAGESGGKKRSQNILAQISLPRARATGRGLAQAKKEAAGTLRNRRPPGQLWAELLRGSSHNAGNRLSHASTLGLKSRGSRPNRDRSRTCRSATDNMRELALGRSRRRLTTLLAIPLDDRLRRLLPLSVRPLTPPAATPPPYASSPAPSPRPRASRDRATRTSRP